MISDEGLEVLRLLSAEERLLMREMVRIAKSKTNIFHEGDLARRKVCKNLDLEDLLHSLSNKGLIHPARPHWWATTRLGREIEHYLQQKDFELRGYRVIR